MCKALLWTVVLFEIAIKIKFYPENLWGYIELFSDGLVGQVERPTINFLA